MLGLPRLLLLIALLLGLWWLGRWFVRLPPEQARRVLIRGVVIAGIVLLVLMAVTGKLHPLLALIGTALGGLAALAQRLLRMPWMLALAQRLFHAHRARQSSAAPTSGRRSQVAARFVRMYLDQDSGEFGGEVIAGRLAGYRLNELDLGQLVGLWRDYRVQDADSAALLEAYLERAHGEAWRVEAAACEGEGQARAADGDDRMGPEEARKILGLGETSTPEDIVAAHRRLAQRLHPDRGGSDYLAAKINRAKDVLLKQTGANN